MPESPHHVSIPIALYSAMAECYYGHGPRHREFTRAEPPLAPAAPPPSAQQEGVPPFAGIAPTARMVPMGINRPRPRMPEPAVPGPAPVPTPTMPPAPSPE